MSTEEKIVKAAEQVFLRDGYDGARMHDIATQAGINKALLHYYFRSKENLFETIFRVKIQDFLPKVSATLFTEIPLIEKMEHIIDQYMELLSQNPFLPIFILQTVNKNPDFVKDLPQDIMKGLVDYFHLEIDKGNINAVQPQQFIPTLIGMCVFPFVARPVIKHLFDWDEDRFQDMIQNRSLELKRYIRYILSPEKK